MKNIIAIVCLFSILSLSACIAQTDNGNMSSDGIENLEINKTEKSNNAENTIEANTIEIGGGDVICPIHTYYYHAIPDEITDYIGKDEFREWVTPTEQIRDENGCYPEGNILKCIEHFDVPNEVIIEAYQNDYYNCEWDMESLLARDAETFERISRESRSDPEYDIYRTKLYNERNLKSRLFDILSDKTDTKTVDYYNLITDNGILIPWCDVSIIDIVINTSLTKSEFEEALNWMNYEDKNGTVRCFEYNLELLFGNEKDLVNLINTLDIPEYESRVKVEDSLLHIEE